MKYTRWGLVLCLVALVWTAAPLGFTRAQTESDYWIYRLDETDDAYHVMKVYVPSGETVELLTISKTTDQDLGSLMTDEEIEETRAYFGGKGFEENEIDEMMKPILSGSVGLIVGPLVSSPDNKQIALSIAYTRYPTWLSPTYFNKTIYGTSHVLVIDGDTGAYHIAWRLGYNSRRFFFDKHIYTVSEVQIHSLAWTLDQQAVIAAISGNYRDSNFRLVVVPLENNTPPFIIGDVSLWDSAPDSRHISAITTDGLHSTLNMFALDLSHGQYLQTLHYDLENHEILPWFGLEYVQGYPVFFVNGDIVYEFSDERGLAVYDPHSHPPVTLYPIAEGSGGYEYIKAAPSGEIAAIQDGNKRLWWLTLEDGVPDMKPATDQPVTFWRFMPDGALVVQYEGHSEYDVLQLE